MTHPRWLWTLFLLAGISTFRCSLRAGELPVRISWGHTSPSARVFTIEFQTQEVTVTSAKPFGFESGDRFERQAIRTRTGGGDIDGVDLCLSFPDRQVLPGTNIHSIWRYLLEHSDDATAARLKADPAVRPDSRKLSIHLNPAGTAGFSLTIDQLTSQRSFWVPAFDLFIATGPQPESYAEHQQRQVGDTGLRVLPAVAEEPEASYEQYKTRWEDMGSPAYQNPAAPEPGHIVCVAWDSALPKFGIDRFAGVRTDLGNADRFKFSTNFRGEGTASPQGLQWKQQKLVDGLPIIQTTFAREDLVCEVEQFAYPLPEPPPERRGDLSMVLLEKLTVQNRSALARHFAFGLQYVRGPDGANAQTRPQGSSWVHGETNGGATFLSLQGTAFQITSNSVSGTNPVTCQIELDLALGPGEEKSIFIKLASPRAPASDLERLLALDYAAVRARTIAFWKEYVERGATFTVPEPAVNELFRANLWHALRLPRRHSATGDKIDLPYSNFAYGQQGTPWPVNQAVYVDYMLYDLRGYHEESAEELRAMFQNNQEPNGHVGGFANWGVYTPGMLYSVAQHYLLSGDRERLNSLLPQTLKALDWCLAELQQATATTGPAQGLVLAPLNDLTHEPRAWAFNQAYFYAGLERLGSALAEIGNPRAEECRQAAARIRRAVEVGFGRAAAAAPAVQLRDGSWSPYVPGDVLTPRRMFEAWYPTDVDCGPLHLSRLRALDARGWLTTAMLNDHEDNLFLHGWGMANEPVYNQQATAYLLRGEPKAAIRAFYSMMACAFSHTVFEPVEHRWAWGQYFGPPSTDGAWFELYRHMLISEQDDRVLSLLQAIPRAWLENGKAIVVERAPTYFGPLSLRVDSRVQEGRIHASVRLGPRKMPEEILLQLRHPQARPLRSVRVNGATWRDFSAVGEWVRIRKPSLPAYEIIGLYD